MKSGKKILPRKSDFTSFVKQLKHLSKQVLLYLRSQILSQREPAGHEI